MSVLIFQPDLLQAIFEKRKSETRRGVKRGDIIQTGIYSLHVCRNNRSLYVPDNLLTVKCSRTGYGVALVELHSVTIEHIKDIDNASAIAEGFEDKQAFVDRWLKLYPKSSAYHWDKNPLVYVLSISFHAWYRRDVFEQALEEQRQKAYTQ